MPGLKPTASLMALLHACAYPFRSDVEIPERETSPEAARGTVFAKLVEQRIGWGEELAFDELSRGLTDEETRRLSLMWRHAQTWLANEQRSGWVAEQPFAWDHVTGEARLLPRAVHRDYACATLTELCGTADIVAFAGDEVTIYDWKTSAPGAPEVDARDQLEALALFAARTYEASSARIVTLRVTAERGVEPMEHEPIDLFGLEDVAARLRADVARIPGAEPSPGEHCRGRYCPALTVCPATAAIVEQIPTVLPSKSLLRKVWKFTPEIESVDHVQALLQMKPMAEAYVEAVGAAIGKYVGDQVLEATDGTTIKATYRTMPRLNVGELQQLARNKGASEEEISACVHARVEGNGIRAAKPKAKKKR